MDELREQKEQMVSTGRKWQHEFLSVRDEKKQPADVQKLTQFGSVKK